LLNHFCRGKPKCYNVLCLSGGAIFVRVILLTALKMRGLSSVQHLSEIFLILIRTERDIVTNVYTYAGLHVQCCCCYQVSMNHEFSRWICEKFADKRRHKNLSSEIRDFRRTDVLTVGEIDTQS